MNEQQLREIAEAAFKRQFADIDIVRINIRQRLDHDDDPVVDVSIFYDDENGEVTGRGYLGVISEVVEKAWDDGKHDLGLSLGPPPRQGRSQADRQRPDALR